MEPCAQSSSNGTERKAQQKSQHCFLTVGSAESGSDRISESTEQELSRDRMTVEVCTARFKASSGADRSTPRDESGTGQTNANTPQGTAILIRASGPFPFVFPGGVAGRAMNEQNAERAPDREAQAASQEGLPERRRGTRRRKREGRVTERGPRDVCGTTDGREGTCYHFGRAAGGKRLDRSGSGIKRGKWLSGNASTTE